MTNQHKDMKAVISKQELHDLFVQGNEKVEALIKGKFDLIDSIGGLHIITLKGGFLIPEQPLTWEAIWDAWRRLSPELHPQMASHYNHLVAQFVKLISRGLDASRSDEVEMKLIIDSQRSLLDWKGLQIPHFLVRHDHLVIEMTDYAFYDLMVTTKRGKKKTVAYLLCGFPHFYVLAVIYVLGMWVAQAQTTPQEAVAKA